MTCRRRHPTDGGSPGNDHGSCRTRTVCDSHRGEITAVEDLDADDASGVGGHVFLHERRAVQPQLQVAVARRTRERVGSVETDDAGAAAADVGLDDDGTAQAFGRIAGLRGYGSPSRSRTES